MESLLNVSRLSVAIRKSGMEREAVSQVGFRVEQGETVCLVGESGSGKTLTALSVMGLGDDHLGLASSGTVDYRGISILQLGDKEKASYRGKRVAMIFQEPSAALDPLYTIEYQLVQSLVTHRRMNKKDARSKAVEWLKRVGIPEPELRMKQYPHQLSGGMNQRVMIAMALAGEPELLIADEPTTALDVTIQAQILKLLRDLKEEQRLSVLLITHDLGLAAEMADRIIVMYAGKVVEQAKAIDLFNRPYHPYTQGLLHSVTTLEDERQYKLPTIEGSVPTLHDMPTGCRFHPRCPYAIERCRVEEPPLQRLQDREVACWLPLNVDAVETNSSFPAKKKVTMKEQVIPTEEKRECVLRAEGITKHYPLHSGWYPGSKRKVHALDNVSFDIYSGETFGLIGESGSGKSTLGRVIVQLERPTDGRLLLDGRDLSQIPRQERADIRKNLQMVFQDPYRSLNPRWKVGDWIAEPLDVHDLMPKKMRVERTKELMSLVGLDPSLCDKYPHEFSGGQRQRIGIARALASNPRLIVADEAVSALDVSVQAQIINLLQDLQSRLGLTFLFIGHSLNVVRHLSERVGVMYLGHLVEIARAEELFTRPAHPYTRALIDSIPSGDPSRRKPFEPLQGEIPSPIDPPAGCRFHTRCPAARPDCRTEAPIMREIGYQRSVACHYPL